MTSTTDQQDLGIGEDGLITEDAFRDIWGARVKPSGDLLEYEDVVNLPKDTVWTIVEGEEHSIAQPGFWVVNKQGYCVTTKPWTDETLDAYWFFNDLESDDEDGEDEEDADSDSND